MVSDTENRPGMSGNETVLVTAASGTVGSKVVPALTETGVEVRIASRDIPSARDRFGDEFEYVEFDFDRPETWGETLADVDGLFLVRPPGVSVGRMGEFVDAASRVGVGHVVYLSVLGAGTNPLVPHHRIERRIRKSGVASTYLRAAYFMQNLLETHRHEIVSDDEICVPAGSGTVGLIDGSDIAAVAACALTESGHTNHAYDLTGPDALDFATVADVFSDVLGRRIEYTNPSTFQFIRRMRSRDLPWPFIAVMVAIYLPTKLGVSGRVTSDVTKILGRSPISLREFVRKNEGAFQPRQDRHDA